MSQIKLIGPQPNCWARVKNFGLDILRLKFTKFVSIILRNYRNCKV